MKLTKILNKKVKYVFIINGYLKGNHYGEPELETLKKYLNFSTQNKFACT